VGAGVWQSDEYDGAVVVAGSRRIMTERQAGAPWPCGRAIPEEAGKRHADATMPRSCRASGRACISRGGNKTEVQFGASGGMQRLLFTVKLMCGLLQLEP
jgi:hypothetical protein